jgi:hypothetical protein
VTAATTVAAAPAAVAGAMTDVRHGKFRCSYLD